MAANGFNVRPPAVAGAFYPASPAELEGVVSGFLAAARQAAPAGSPATRTPKAIIAPHAGYVYSGAIAGSAFAALDRPPGAAAAIRKVVLLGPAHRVPVRGLALPEASGFATPLGVV